MEPVKIIGRIELPVESPTLYHCVGCGLYKPSKDFPYGHAMSLYDCYDCEFRDMSWDEPPPRPRGGIEQNFTEEWISGLEEELGEL